MFSNSSGLKLRAFFKSSVFVTDYFVERGSKTEKSRKGNGRNKAPFTTTGFLERARKLNI